MFKIKRIVFVLVALAMLVTACGTPPAAAPTAAPQPTAAPPTQAPAAQPVELRIAWWGSQARHDRTIAVIELFQKKYPNIKIAYEYALWDDYWVKMNTQAAGNNLPDIVQQDYQKIAEWYSKKLLMPLDPYIADGTINLKNVAEASIKGGVLADGKKYAINLGNNTLCFELTWMLSRKGIDLPSDKWTWADFEKIAMAFREKANMWRLRFPTTGSCGGQFTWLWTRTSGPMTGPCSAIPRSDQSMRIS
jgi:multiple sugar transport system substrate-binding protein